MIDSINNSTNRRDSSKYKYLLHFFLTAMDKNNMSRSLFHRYIPGEVFYEKMKSVVREAFWSSNPRHLEFSSSIFDAKARDTNYFAIGEMASAVGLKPGDCYVDSDNGIITRLQFDRKKEEYFKKCREKFRSCLIENINSTKWTMQYSDVSHNNDGFSLKEIKKMGNVYGKTAMMDVATFGMGKVFGKINRKIYNWGKGIEKIHPKLSQTMKKSFGHKTLSLGLTKNPKISPSEIVEDSVMGFLYPKESIEVGFDNEWMRTVCHKKNQVVHPFVSKYTNSNNADNYVGFLDKKDAFKLKGLDTITDVIPHFAISKAFVSIVMNGSLYCIYNGIPYIYDGIVQKAEESESLSDEKWANLLKPYLVQDVEKLTDDGMYYLCKYFNVGDCEWLREKKWN